MKLIDTFPFFNELDLLDVRLHELESIVDRHVLVESTRTFSGEPKPLYFAENKERFRRFLHKITHVVVDDSPCTGNAWDNERHQRDAVVRGLVECAPDDLVLICDVDEIPRKSVIENFTGDEAATRMSLYYYYINCLMEVDSECGVISRYSRIVAAGGPCNKRHERFRLPRLLGSGWHFSYLGGAERIRAKLSSHAHQEYNRPPYNDLATIRQKIGTGDDLFNRGISGRWMVVDESYPAYVRDNPEIFDKYVHRSERPTRLDGQAYGLGRTHEPLLAAVVAVAERGPVLELGAGYASTPLLHTICAAQGRRLLTVDSNPEWIEKFSSLRSDDHHLVTLDTWDKLPDLAHAFAEGSWAVVFIDHAPAERRIVDLVYFANKTEFLVVHDTEHSLYGYEPVLTTFPYRADYRRMVPWTSVLSLVHPFPASDLHVPS